MILTALILGLFGIYLLSYSAYVLWEYHVVVIREALERDSHGMSRVVGYTFVFLLGAMSFGVGVVAWCSKEITDTKARHALTLGLFVLSLCGFLVSLFLQIHYWETRWGKLYLATFIAVGIILGYKRFIRNAN